MLTPGPRDTPDGHRLPVTSAGSTPQCTARIGVVIPYFHTEAGLLYRALSSVAAQRHSPVQVIVVDDGSPRGAGEEITPALRSALPGLTLIRQTNRGIAAARNAALDALAQDVTAVALLDSDDYWEPTHLQNAAAALSHGADFFFSNSRSEGDGEDHFEQPSRRRLLGYGEPVEGAPGVARWTLRCTCCGEDKGAHFARFGTCFDPIQCVQRRGASNSRS